MIYSRYFLNKYIKKKKKVKKIVLETTNNDYKAYKTIKWLKYYSKKEVKRRFTITPLLSCMIIIVLYIYIFL